MSKKDSKYFYYFRDLGW